MTEGKTNNIYIIVFNFIYIIYKKLYVHKYDLIYTYIFPVFQKHREQIIASTIIIRKDEIVKTDKGM